MTELIQPPAPGGDLEASWGAAVTEGVNRMEMMFPSGGLARQYAGGCGFAPLPVNHRGVARTGGINLFTVREVKEDSEKGIPYTGWEIYMPEGCVSVGTTCQPMNPTAYRMKDGKREDLAGWFRMPFPDGNPEDGDSWTVKIHAKCCAALSGIDNFEDWPKKYAWANIEDPDMTQDEREEDQNDVGDTFSTFVGSIRWRELENDDGTTKLKPSYLHGVKTPIFVNNDIASSAFRLFCAFTVDEDSAELTFDRLFVTGSVFTAGGASYLTDSLKEVDKDTEAIYLKISTKTSPYTGEIKPYKTISKPQGDDMSVPEQVQDDTEDGVMLVMLYTLVNGHVTADNRSALNNVQLYQ